MDAFKAKIGASQVAMLTAVSHIHEALELEHASILKRREKLEGLLKTMATFAESKRDPARKGKPGGLLKLSVGGEPIDVLATTLSGNGMHPNLLSNILSSGRWDPFFLRDRESRIFLDFEADWVEPVINYFRDICNSPPGEEIEMPRVRPIFMNGFEKVQSLFGLVDESGPTKFSERSAIRVVNERASKRPFTQLVSSVKADPDSPSAAFLDKIKCLFSALDSAPEGLTALVQELVVARASVAQQEEELLRETLLARHLFLKPLSEFVTATQVDSDAGGDKSSSKAKGASEMNTCDKIDAVFTKMIQILADREKKHSGGGPAGSGDLIFFNIGGKRLAIRKQTLASSLPDSALAVDVSAWGDQDLDAFEGHIFLDFGGAARAAFMAILSFARLKALSDGLADEKSCVIMVESEHVNALTHLKDKYRVSADHEVVFK